MEITKGITIWKPSNAPEWAMNHAPYNGDDLTHVAWLPLDGGFLPTWIGPQTPFGNGFKLVPVEEPPGFLAFGLEDD